MRAGDAHPNPGPSLRIAQINICGLNIRLKKDSLVQQAASLRLNVILLQGTHLTEDESSDLSMSGCHCFARERDAKGGGVAVLVRKTLPATLVYQCRIGVLGKLTGSVQVGREPATLSPPTSSVGGRPLLQPLFTSRTQIGNCVSSVRTRSAVNAHGTRTSLRPLVALTSFCSALLWTTQCSTAGSRHVEAKPPTKGPTRHHMHLSPAAASLESGHLRGTQTVSLPDHIRGRHQRRRASGVPYGSEGSFAWGRADWPRFGQTVRQDMLSSPAGSLDQQANALRNANLHAVSGPDDVYNEALMHLPRGGG